MKKVTEFLNEASLSRVWQHVKSDKTIVMFSAFRSENSLIANLANNKKAASELSSNKFGYFFVDGYFTENKGTPKEEKVKEDSIFAIGEKERSQELIDLCHKIANKYNQDSIFVKTEDETYFLDRNGKKESLNGKFSPNKIGEYYSQLKNNKAANKFVFESTFEHYPAMTSWAISNHLKNNPQK